MVIREQALTAEAFWQIAELPENQDKRLELVNGVVVEMASSSPLNTVTAARLAHDLNAFVILRDLGYVTGANGGFKVGPRQMRQPDVAFISKARLPTLPAHFDLAPDLAIEVVSENEDVFKKALDYLRAGTTSVWAVYAEDRMVHVLTLDDDGGLRSRAFGIDDMLDGGRALPGFSLAVRDVFPAS